MDTTITLNKAKSELRIGRDRLIKLLKDFQIEVIQRIKFLLQFSKKKKLVLLTLERTSESH
jgi:hypothetical protein